MSVESDGIEVEIFPKPRDQYQDEFFEVLDPSNTDSLDGSRALIYMEQLLRRNGRSPQETDDISANLSRIFSPTDKMIPAYFGGGRKGLTYGTSDIFLFRGDGPRTAQAQIRNDSSIFGEAGKVVIGTEVLDHAAAFYRYSPDREWTITASAILGKHLREYRVDNSMDLRSLIVSDDPEYIERIFKGEDDPCIIALGGEAVASAIDHSRRRAPTSPDISLTEGLMGNLLSLMLETEVEREFVNPAVDELYYQSLREFVGTSWKGYGRGVQTSILLHGDLFEELIGEKLDIDRCLESIVKGLEVNSLDLPRLHNWRKKFDSFYLENDNDVNDACESVGRIGLIEPIVSGRALQGIRSNELTLQKWEAELASSPIIKKMIAEGILRGYSWASLRPKARELKDYIGNFAVDTA